MLPEVRGYLESVRSHLYLDPAIEKRVIGELHTYFKEKIDDLRDNGLSEKEAIAEAIRSFGRARAIARLMYEAYSKGTWTETILTALPHLIVAGMFLSHLWHHPVLAPVAFAALVLVTLFGWRHGKPNWLYSWVGYALLPLLIGGYASFATLKQTASFLLRGQGSLPHIWILLLIGALFAFSLWVIISTTIRVVRRDWILASLMLVPLPVMGSWLFQIYQSAGLFQGNLAAFNQWDISMALVLSVLAVASATFVRLRKRMFKGIALMTLAFLAMTIIGHILWAGQGLLVFLAASVLSLLFLLSPALLEARVGHGEPNEEAWWAGDWVEHPSGMR